MRPVQRRGDGSGGRRGSPACPTAQVPAQYVHAVPLCTSCAISSFSNSSSVSPPPRPPWPHRHRPRSSPRRRLLGRGGGCYWLARGAALVEPPGGPERRRALVGRRAGAPEAPRPHRRAQKVVRVVGHRGHRRHPPASRRRTGAEPGSRPGDSRVGGLEHDREQRPVVAEQPPLPSRVCPPVGTAQCHHAVTRRRTAHQRQYHRRCCCCCCCCYYYHHHRRHRAQRPFSPLLVCGAAWSTRGQSPQGPLPRAAVRDARRRRLAQEQRPIVARRPRGSRSPALSLLLSAADTSTARRGGHSEGGGGRG